MRSGSGSFTLIEVMLAVAIFAFAVVGFQRALNDVLGVNSEILRTAQRRQAVESVLAQILAVSNNLVERDWERIPDLGSEATWSVYSQFREVKVEVLDANDSPLPLFGWFCADVEARDSQEKPVDRISVLLWGQR